MGPTKIGQEMAHNEKEFSLNIIMSLNIRRIRVEKPMKNQPIGNQDKIRLKVIKHQLTNKKPRNSNSREAFNPKQLDPLYKLFSRMNKSGQSFSLASLAYKGNYLSALFITSVQKILDH